MSHLQSLALHHFRNLDKVELDCNPRCNILYGLNGSGKTSFLEAIYYLSLGRSFRTRSTNRIVQYDQPNFTIHSLIQERQIIPVGVERKANGQVLIKINHTPVQSIAELAKLLPTQLIYPDGHKILLGGSKPRRQFMDWGVFHVEHHFLSIWQRAQRALLHRNALLKEITLDTTQLDVWDEDLFQTSALIHQARQKYLDRFVPLFEKTLHQLLPDFEISLAYHPGWDLNKPFSEILLANRKRDKSQGFTQYGPHKADLLLTHRQRALSESISQGQQKLVNYALKLAQGILLYNDTETPSIYLIDDLPAELDETKRHLLTNVLSEMNAQVFLTGIDQAQVASIASQIPSTMFHVEQGVIKAVSS
jgi:DNA replication and repair protein RecF